MLQKLQGTILTCFIALATSLSFGSIAFAKTITLDLNHDGQTQQFDTSNELPAPQRTGWIFGGWYSGPVSITLDEQELINGKTNDHFLCWTITPSGNKIENASSIPEETKTLYASWKPTIINFKLYQNGWAGGDGALECGREYGTPFNGIVYNMTTIPWDGHTFDGWYDAPHGGNRFDTEHGQLTGQNLYMHWHGNDGSSSENHELPTWGEPVDIKISPRDIRIDPNSTNPTTVEAAVHTESNIRANPENISFEISNNSMASIEQNEEWVKITPKGITGTVDLIAKVKTSDGRILQDKITITLDHTFDQKIYVTKYPNCTEGGKGYTLCRICGARKNITWEPDGHRFTYHRTNATCTQDGCEDRYCVVCGLHEHETKIPALGHSYSTKRISTCTGMTQIKTCATCGDTETITSENGASHSWTTTKVVDKNPTCKTEGSKSYHCTKCQLTKGSETIPVTTTHTFGAWNITEKPTEENVGTQERTCSICGIKETETLAKLPVSNIEPSNSTPQTPNNNEVPGISGGSISSGNSGISGGSGGGSGAPSVTPAKPTPSNPNETPTDKPTETPDSIIIYRLYNKYNGGHLLTVNKSEVDSLIKLGWTYEGESAKASSSGTPVYRLYNSLTGEHLFTTSKAEYDKLGSIGWTKEDIAWYSSGSIPMYRLYNPYITDGPNHLYTTNKTEYDNLGKIGWNKEGVAWNCEG